MAKQRSPRGFTRLDALIAGVACLILIVLVVVLLGKLRERSTRSVCAANLAQIGKTMFLYANDNDSNLPRAGGRDSRWGVLPNFAGVSHAQAFGLAPDGSGGTASISSSFYLLVKYYQTPTKLFLCPGDEGTTEFKLGDLTISVTTSTELIDLWDFGPYATAFKSCSFAYHHPYSQYPLKTSRDPNLAVAADRNPWIKSPMADPVPVVLFRPDLVKFQGTAEQARVGNAVAHGKDGQNVLFLDGTVTFQTRAYCGVDQDNIYTSWDGNDKIRGVPPKLGSVPADAKDSLLVNDPPHSSR